MSFNKSFKEVLEEAKRAFEDMDKTSYEKQKVRHKNDSYFPKHKSIGFIDGTKQVIVWQ
jgi:hypothetical protein